MLGINNSKVPKLYLGNTECKKAYLGDTLVLDNSGPEFQYIAGRDWFEVTTPYRETYRCVSYGNNKFVTLSYGNSYYSTDGIIWEKSNFDSYFPVDVAYGNGRFVVACYDSNDKFRICYSDDGITWIYTFGGTTFRPTAIAFVNNKFAVVSEKDTSVCFSDDGITWEWSRIGSDQKWCSIAYGNGVFVICGSSSRVARSEDGANWSTSKYIVGFPPGGNITYFKDKFVIAGSNGFATSRDGLTWDTGKFSTSDVKKGIAIGDNKVVAVGFKNSYYSTNGNNWSEAPMPTGSNWQDVAYGQNKFVSVSTDKTAYSFTGNELPA